MAEGTKIEWTSWVDGSGTRQAGNTFNAWIGCSKVSKSCDNCYAERFGFRQGVKWGAGEPRRRTSPGNWSKPMQWNRAAEQHGGRPKVFCSSLADVFDVEVPEEWRFDLFRVIDKTPNLDWLLLTKRSKPMMDRLGDRDWWQKAIGRVPDGLFLPNVWLGCTVEEQKTADLRIPHLMKTPAAIRFLSMEPLFGPVTLPADFLALGKRAWVITGGESGPKTRLTDPDWYRMLRDQAVPAGVPFHHKQYGDAAPVDCLPASAIIPPNARRAHLNGREFAYIGKHEAGRVLDGRTWDEAPETYPASATLF